VLAILAIGAILIFRLGEHGLSARNQPSSLESFLADQARVMFIPVKARKLENPLPPAPVLVARGRDHWADHCATCHANNGSGDSELGKNLYPRAPDMRGARTQSLSDGELYYIIRNGVPWTGMPAWGNADLGDLDSETWALVLFIRHLPKLSAAEETAMEKLNPKGTMEREEEQQEEDFLNGKAPMEEKHDH
jgi:mono/diheme cytochrome c family protein